MKQDRNRRRRSEDGIALLIAIFVLLLISVVAIALLVSSGTETALGANYRASSTVYYAALAGLEEARGRLLPKNPNYFGASVISPTTPFPLGQSIYVLNQLTGENVVPWDSSNLYYDNEYQSEFGVPASSASWQSVNSVWNNNALGIPGPIYKWVRITAATEQSLYLDVNSDGVYDHSTPIYYDPAAVNSSGNPAPSLIVTPSPPSTAVQVLQITSLAYLPNGSKKILQYLVAPTGASLSFPAAVTLDGNDIGDPSKPSLPFSVPDLASFSVNGNDQSSPLSPAPPTSPPPAPYTCVPTTAVYGIGYINSSDGSLNDMTIFAVNSGAIHGSSGSSYTGYVGPGVHTLPNVNLVGPGAPAGGPVLATNLLNVYGLNTLASTITQNADIVINGPANQSALPSAMTAANPMTIAVTGDLNLTGWSGAGYGTLLVTGTLTFDPNASWYGVILVIGNGILNSGYEGGGTPGEIAGAVLVARTLDQWNNPLTPSSSPPLSPSFNYNESNRSLGIFYNSCWVQYTLPAGKYQVLSFHEVPQ
jgi:hypothetical protein